MWVAGGSSSQATRGNGPEAAGVPGMLQEQQGSQVGWRGMSWGEEEGNTCKMPGTC